MSNPIIEHLTELAKTEPIEAGVMFVQSATSPDPKDPLKLPWSVPTALRFAKSTLDLTDEQVLQVAQRLLTSES